MRTLAGDTVVTRGRVPRQGFRPPQHDKPRRKKAPKHSGARLRSNRRKKRIQNSNTDRLWILHGPAQWVVVDPCHASCPLACFVCSLSYVHTFSTTHITHPSNHTIKHKTITPAIPPHPQPPPGTAGARHTPAAGQGRPRPNTPPSEGRRSEPRRGPSGGARAAAGWGRRRGGG